MADQGSVAKLSAGAVMPAPFQRSVDPSGRPAGSSGANAGAGRFIDPKIGNRQWVDIDGQQFSKSARRGTYLNILV